MPFAADQTPSHTTVTPNMPATAPRTRQTLREVCAALASEADLRALLAHSTTPATEIWGMVARHGSAQVLSPWVVRFLRGQPQHLPALLENPACPPEVAASVHGWAVRYLGATRATKRPVADVAHALLRTHFASGRVPRDAPIVARVVRIFSTAVVAKHRQQIDRSMAVLLALPDLDAVFLLQLAALVPPGTPAVLGILADQAAAPVTLWRRWLTENRTLGALAAALRNSAGGAQPAFRTMLLEVTVDAAKRSDVLRFVLAHTPPDEPVAEQRAVLRELLQIAPRVALRVIGADPTRWCALLAADDLVPALTAAEGDLRATALSLVGTLPGGGPLAEPPRIIPLPRAQR
jgi:hypothetical protein